MCFVWYFLIENQLFIIVTYSNTCYRMLFFALKTPEYVIYATKSYILYN